MAVMEFDEAAAEKLEAAYLGPDVVAQRSDTLARLAPQPGESVLDIGSGPGFLAEDIAISTGPTGRVIGIDVSAEMVNRAEARSECEWLSYQVGDATNLPFADASFDVVVSTQVAEYVPDTDAFCHEVARVLKPGGRGLVLATDWGAVCWHSERPDRMQRVLEAFAPHCAHSSLPRLLPAKLRASGLVLDGVSYFPILNVDRYEGCYEEMMVPLITAFVASQGTLPEKELADWAKEQAELNARGAHFFASGRFIFMVSKPDPQAN